MSHIIKNMLEDLYNNGYEQTDIMKSICNALGKYFLNKDILRNYRSHSELLSVFEFEIRYYHEPDFSEGIMSVLKCYRDAYSVSPKETLNIFISTLSEASEKENQMWTVRNNAPQEVGDDIYDSVISYMKHIGDTLEISVKYIIQELYAMIRIAKKQSVDYGKIKACDFGVAINNVLSCGYFENLLKTKPIDIKLSDWRNIAYHHGYLIHENRLTCSYGKPVKQFNITFDEFLTYCHQIIKFGNVFNIARCIFAFDNIDELISIKDTEKTDILFRKPLLVEQLKISFMGQGFHLDSFMENEKEVTMILIDLINNKQIDPEELMRREIHASQLLYNIWCVFKKSLVQIIYCDCDGKRIMHISVDGDICHNVDLGTPISYMAKHVKWMKLV